MKYNISNDCQNTFTQVVFQNPPFPHCSLKTISLFLPDAESKVNQKIVRNAADIKRCGSRRKRWRNCKYRGCFRCREKFVA